MRVTWRRMHLHSLWGQHDVCKCPSTRRLKHAHLHRIAFCSLCILRTVLILTYSMGHIASCVLSGSSCISLRLKNYSTICQIRMESLWVCLLLKITFGSFSVFKRPIEDPSYGRDCSRPYKVHPEAGGVCWGYIVPDILEIDFLGQHVAMVVETYMFISKHACATWNKKLECWGDKWKHRVFLLVDCVGVISFQW